MTTEAEDIAEACRLLVSERQVNLMRVVYLLDSPFEAVEAAFNQYKRAVFRYQEYEALAKKYVENG